VILSTGATVCRRALHPIDDMAMRAALDNAEIAHGRSYMPQVVEVSRNSSVSELDWIFEGRSCQIAT
jgi:hypothetical protein